MWKNLNHSFNFAWKRKSRCSEQRTESRPLAERMAASLHPKITLERCSGKEGERLAAFPVEDNGFVPVTGREFPAELPSSLFFVRKAEKLSGTAMLSPQPAMRE